MPGASWGLRLSYRGVGKLVALIAAVNVFFISGTGLALVALRSGEQLPVAWQGVSQYVLSQLNLGAENVLAAWYSSFLLLAVAMAAVVCFLIDRQRAGSEWSRTLAVGWLILAALFVGLSADELGSLHERLGDWRGTGWVTLLAVPIGLVGLFLLAFGWIRLRRCLPAALLMTLGVAFFLAVPVLERMEVRLLTEGATLGVQRPIFDALLEEGFELFGMLAFLAAFTTYAVWTSARPSPEGGTRTAYLGRPGRAAVAVATLVTAVLSAGLIAALVTSTERPNTSRDSLWVAMFFDAAVRGYDADLAAAFAAPDIELRIVPPPAGESGVYQGRESLREWVRQAQAQGLSIRQYAQQADGPTINWRGTALQESWRTEGLPPVWMTSQAQVANGKITSYTLDFSARLGEAWGLIENWFPSAAAAVAGFLALATWIGAPPADRRRRFLGLGAFCLLISAYFGANLSAYENWGAFDLARQLLREGLSAAAIGLGVLLFVRTRSSGRGFVVAWVILLTIALGVERLYSLPLAFLAFATLSAGLLMRGRLVPAPEPAGEPNASAASEGQADLVGAAV